jgi:hypothetical protein
MFASNHNLNNRNWLRLHITLLMSSCRIYTFLSPFCFLLTCCCTLSEDFKSQGQKLSCTQRNHLDKTSNNNITLQEDFVCVFFIISKYLDKQDKQLKQKFLLGCYLCLRSLSCLFRTMLLLKSWVPISQKIHWMHPVKTIAWSSWHDIIGYR